jgi:hypothetical protein
VGEYRSVSDSYWLNAPSLLGRGLPMTHSALKELFREMRGLLLPSVVSGGAFFYFQNNTSASHALHGEWATSTDLLLILALVSCFFCGTALEIFTERLIAPFWHRVRERRPASTANSAGTSRSIRQWLCSPSHNEKNTRPYRWVQIKHNPPPQVPPLSTYSYI